MTNFTLFVCLFILYLHRKIQQRHMDRLSASFLPIHWNIPFYNEDDHVDLVVEMLIVPMKKWPQSLWTMWLILLYSFFLKKRLQIQTIMNLEVFFSLFLYTNIIIIGLVFFLPPLTGWREIDELKPGKYQFMIQYIWAIRTCEVKIFHQIIPIKSI